MAKTKKASANARTKIVGVSVRGAVALGKVVSTKMKKTVVVERQLTKKISKYKRTAKVRSKLHAHLPDGIKVNVGDIVEVGQCRKISKTKAWIVLRVVKRGGER